MCHSVSGSPSGSSPIEQFFQRAKAEDAHARPVDAGRAASASVSTSDQPTSPSSVVTLTSSCQSPLSTASAALCVSAIRLLAAEKNRFDIGDAHGGLLHGTSRTPRRSSRAFLIGPSLRTESPDARRKPRLPSASERKSSQLPVPVTLADSDWPATSTTIVFPAAYQHMNSRRDTIIPFAAGWNLECPALHGPPDCSTSRDWVIFLPASASGQNVGPQSPEDAANLSSTMAGRFQADCQPPAWAAACCFQIGNKIGHFLGRHLP